MGFLFAGDLEVGAVDSNQQLPLAATPELSFQTMNPARYLTRLTL